MPTQYFTQDPLILISFSLGKTRIAVVIKDHTKKMSAVRKIAVPVPIVGMMLLAFWKILAARRLAINNNRKEARVWSANFHHTFFFFVILYASTQLMVWVMIHITQRMTAASSIPVPMTLKLFMNI